jgi:hypothetical protein
MTGGILYLDVDDEITSAAARIRGAEERRVAVVLPYGSRVATSRINFRLLARDALTHEKRLSIVSSDAATRALAASAGLPIFGTVAEYETSLEPKGGTGGMAADTSSDGAAPGVAIAAASAVAAAGAAAAPIDAGATPATGPARRRRSKRAAAADGEADGAPAPADSPGSEAPIAPDDTATAAVVAGAAATAAVGVDRAAAAAPVTAHRVPSPAATSTRARPAETIPPPVRTAPVVRPGRPHIGRTPVIIGVAVLGLAAVIGGVGAYLLLPTATIVVTPRVETIGPLRMTVAADPAAEAPDAEAGVVPAETVSVDVAASDTFRSTGKRVEQEAASGRVTFQSFNTSSSNTIPGGSIVSTEGGTQFRTARAVTLAKATVQFPATVIPSSASVNVTAVKDGTSGNVPANSITVVPRGEDPSITNVRNADATSGGSRKEFPRVSRKDVQTATAAMEERLAAEFADRLEDPELAADGATVFPATASLGEAVFEDDPADFVNDEREEFELTATASGTVRAVQTDAVQAIAEERLTTQVEAGHELVPDSSEITVDDAVVSEGTITFPVLATASQVPILDAAEIEAAIRGRSLDEAQGILDTFGTWDLSVWPEWVTTIPTLDARLDVTVDDSTTSEEPTASASPAEDGS